MENRHLKESEVGQAKACVGGRGAGMDERPKKQGGPEKAEKKSVVEHILCLPKVLGLIPGINSN